MNKEKLRQIIKGLRNKVGEDDFDELVATMLSLAKLKKGWRTLMAVIRSAAAKEKPMHPFLRDGIEQGLEKGLAPLARVFEWRLGRPLTESERSRLAKRMTQGDSAALGDVVINLSPEQLAAWLAPRRTSKRSG